ncbi:uncharacterized protein GJ701_000782 [Geothlypis trichas]
MECEQVNAGSDNVLIILYVIFISLVGSQSRKTFHLSSALISSEWALRLKGGAALRFPERQGPAPSPPLTAAPPGPARGSPRPAAVHAGSAAVSRATPPGPERRAGRGRAEGESRPCPEPPLLRGSSPGPRWRNPRRERLGRGAPRTAGKRREHPPHPPAAAEPCASSWLRLAC